MGSRRAVVPATLMLSRHSRAQRGRAAQIHARSWDVMASSYAQVPVSTDSESDEGVALVREARRGVTGGKASRRDDAAGDGLPLGGDGDPPTGLDTVDIEPVVAVAVPAKKFPWARTWIVFFVVCTNGIAFTAPTTFLPAMVENRWGVSEVDSGRTVGILAGAFSMMQFFSSSFIGHLSDRYGRRPLMIVGCGVCFFLLLAFGLSPTFWVALVNRALEGTFNSNIPVVKAYLSDVIPDSTTRALAFGYFGASFSLSRVISAALSGFISDAATPGPPLYMEYALPCFLLSPPLLFAAVFVWRCLPESRAKQSAARPGEKKMSWCQGLAVLFRDSLMMRCSVLYMVNSFCNGGILVLNVLFLALSVGRLGMGLEPTHVGMALSLFGATSAIYQFTAAKKVVSALQPLRTYMYVGCAALCLGCLVTPLAAWPVAASSCLPASEGGGADAIATLEGHAHAASHGITPSGHRMLLGAAMEAVGSDPWTSDMLIRGIAPVHGRALSTCNATGPVLGEGVDPSRCDGHLVWVAWLILLVGFTLQSIGFMSCLPMVTVFLTNVAPRDIQGLSQGTAQSLASLLRSIGPFVSGLVFTWASAARMPFLAYGVPAAGYALCFFIAATLPRHVEKARDDW